MSAFLRKRDPYPAWQNVAIVAWTGMRGVVSLAAALAVPLTLSDGSPFPGRDYIFFITFCVILATLVLQGLSLPGLIRRLGVVDDGLETMEERTARLKANEAAVAYLAEVDSQFPADIVERLRAEYDDRIRQLEAFINRFRYQATKAKQVQSRIKELDKIERIEIPPDEKAIHFTFPQPKPSGRVVAEFKSVSKRYGPLEVFRGVNFMIERGDRVALVGVNGAGKSTLIKLLAGTEPLTSGEYKLGHNAQPDYFAQDQYKELDPDGRLLDDLADVAGHANQTELRSLLGCFLFSEDDVFKRIGVLSGGERNRYALAKLLVRPSNFLLLDEPTNHLDMRAKDVLLEALEKFTGTVVFVSHDRYFIDRLATRVFEIGGGEVRIYPGNYEDYLWRKEGGEIDLTLPVNGTSAPAPEAAETAALKQKRLNPMKLRKMQDRCRELETAISELESAIASQEAALADFRSAEETIRRAEALGQSRAQLAQRLSEWEEVTQAIEANQ